MWPASSALSATYTGCDLTADVEHGELREVLLRARGLEDEALEWLFHRYANRVFRYVLGHAGHQELAEDVTAEIFAGLPGRLQTYRVPAQDVPARFAAWLYRVAHNEMVDWMRRAQRQAQAVAALSEAEPVSVSRTLERLLAAEEVRAAMAVPTEEQREVLILRFYEELSLSETSELVGRSVEAVKGLQKRALAALGRELRRREQG